MTDPDKPTANPLVDYYFLAKPQVSDGYYYAGTKGQYYFYDQENRRPVFQNEVREVAEIDSE